MLFIQLGLFFITSPLIDRRSIPGSVWCWEPSLRCVPKVVWACGYIWKSEVPLCGVSFGVDGAHMANFLLVPSSSISMPSSNLAVERDDRVQEALDGKVWVNINPDTGQTPCRLQSTDHPPSHPFMKLILLMPSPTFLGMPYSQLLAFENFTIILLCT